jgi:ketosteroid isomerase-like protein
MNGRDFTEAFLAGDAEGAAALLSEDAVFHSPVRDYRGRARVAEVLGLVTRELGRGEIEQVLEDDAETVTFFSAGELEGMLRVRGSTDVTLMARPLKVLLPAVERLQSAAP